MNTQDRQPEGGTQDATSVYTPRQLALLRSMPNDCLVAMVSTSGAAYWGMVQEMMRRLSSPPPAPSNQATAEALHNSDAVSNLVKSATAMIDGLERDGLDTGMGGYTSDLRDALAALPKSPDQKAAECVAASGPLGEMGEVGRLRKVIRDLEWSVTKEDHVTGDPYQACPACGRGDPASAHELLAGHERDCKIALALATAEGGTK